MSDRGTAWSITINNPTSSDEEFIALARQKGWTVQGQLEKGAEGTPHYQLLVKTPQVRFSAVKKAFPRAHIELARNVKALETYVAKDDTRVGQLPSSSEKYPSLAKFWHLVCKKYTAVILSYDHGHERPAQLLANFDKVVGLLIEEGYHVETMAVNPQMRACWKNYSNALFERCNLEDRQTDRQAEILSQLVVIPTTDADEEEVSSQEGSSEGSSEGSQDESDEEFSESEYPEV